MPLPASPSLEISTERLRLVPVSEWHLGDLFAVNGDDEVTRFLPYATWTCEADGRAWLARMQALVEAGATLQLVLTLKDTGQAIGTLLLFKWDETSRRLEVGYALGRAHWHQGFMHEALEAACRHAFTHIGCRRLEAEVNPENEPSCRLLERLGFTREGRLRQRWTAKGRSHDTFMYGLLEADWRTASGTRPDEAAEEAAEGAADEAPSDRPA